jgi:chromosome segregation ATPase
MKNYADHSTSSAFQSWITDRLTELESHLSGIAASFKSLMDDQKSGMFQLHATQLKTAARVDDMGVRLAELEVKDIASNHVTDRDGGLEMGVICDRIDSIIERIDERTARHVELDHTLAETIRELATVQGRLLRLETANEELRQAIQDARQNDAKASALQPPIHYPPTPIGAIFRGEMGKDSDSHHGTSAGARWDKPL